MQVRKFQIDKTVLNPIAYYLLCQYNNPQYRFIILYGGSSSGKSYSIAQTILLQTLKDRQNTIVFRKVGASISKTIFEDFKVAMRQMGLEDQFRLKESLRQIICTANNARIDFQGLDDDEKIKGISNYKRVVMDEWSEFEEEDFKQIRKRLRGKEGQQIITAFNPIKETHWIKRTFFDVDKWEDIPMTVELYGQEIPPEYTQVKSLRRNLPKQIRNIRSGEIEEHPSDTLVIQSTYLNNFWVVGSPDGTYGFYDRQCIADFERDRLFDPDYYNVYALGEWGVIRTGSEFFNAFNIGRHTARVEYDPELPVHISVDSNVLPYITCTYWQIDTSKGFHIRQIGETLAESPNNTVRKSARLVARRLQEYGSGKVYLHGDASTKAANNIDDEKRSFLDLFIDTLQKEGVEVEDKVGNKNPSVSMSGEFVNAIWDLVFPEISLTIGDECKTSIEDYLSVQKDVNGAILKTKVKNKTTGQTYEEHGHISDTLRYIVTDVLKDEFLAFSNRRKRNTYAKDGLIQFYNPETDNKYSAHILYIIPNINGKFAMVEGKLCGQRWHIVDAMLYETESTDFIREEILRRSANKIARYAMTVVMESHESYFPFIRRLRDEIADVRARKLTTEITRRISATSDLVRSMLSFNPDLADEGKQYSVFLNNLLDYGSNPESIEAGACLSGFIEYASKVDISHK